MNFSSDKTSPHFSVNSIEFTWYDNSLYQQYLDWVQAKKHDTFHFENEAQNGYVRWDPEFNIHVFHRMYRCDCQFCQS